MRALLIAVAAFLVLAAPASARSTSLVISQVATAGGDGHGGVPRRLKNVATSAINRGPLRDVVPQRRDRATRRTGRSTCPASPRCRAAIALVVAPTSCRTPPELRPGTSTSRRSNADPERRSPDALAIVLGRSLGRPTVVATTVLGCDAAARRKDLVGYGAANDSETARADAEQHDLGVRRRLRHRRQRRRLRARRHHARRVQRRARLRRPRRSTPRRPSPTRPRRTAPRRCRSTRTSRSRFSEPVDLAADAVSISCADSGVHAAVAIRRSGRRSPSTRTPTSPATRVHRDGRGRRRQRPGRGRPAEQRWRRTSASRSPRSAWPACGSTTSRAPRTSRRYDGDFVVDVPGVVTAVREQRLLVPGSAAGQRPERPPRASSSSPASAPNAAPSARR